MSITNVLHKIIMAFGVLAVAVGIQFGLAKLTKITLVISPTHCYFGSVQEMPSPVEGGNY